jgi:DNA-binding MarR family transcriptional regulator
MELWKQDGLRQVDMASRLAVSPPTINKTIKGMVDSGFVTCRRVAGDARSTRIFLTEKGSAVRDAVTEQWHELEESVVSGLTEAERLILFELLTKLKGVSQDDGDEE